MINCRCAEETLNRRGADYRYIGAATQRLRREIKKNNRPLLFLNRKPNCLSSAPPLRPCASAVENFIPAPLSVSRQSISRKGNLSRWKYIHRRSKLVHFEPIRPGNQRRIVSYRGQACPLSTDRCARCCFVDGPTEQH